MRSVLPRVMVVLGLVMGLGLMALNQAWGQSQAQLAAQRATIPMLGVTKTDNTTVRGQLVSMTPEKITLRVKETEVEVPWKEVRSLSNGMTRAKTAEKFRREHGGQYCLTCLGTGQMNCETCKGTGHELNAETDKNCVACKGELLVACKTAKCKDGMIPCPNVCLKRNEGNWVVNDPKHEGKTVRLLPNGAWVSEAHVGELLSRDAKGMYQGTSGDCPTCLKKSIVADPVCMGTGKIPCPVHSRAETPKCKVCQVGKVECKACGGSGMKRDSVAPAETPAATDTPAVTPPATEVPSGTPAAPATPPANPVAPAPGDLPSAPKGPQGADPDPPPAP